MLFPGTYTVRFNTELIDTVKPHLRKWDGLKVTVTEVRLISDGLKELFPNDKMMGFVLEMIADLPESELI